MEKHTPSKVFVLLGAIAIMMIGGAKFSNAAATNVENVKEECTVETCGTNEEIDDITDDTSLLDVSCTKDTWSCGAWGLCLSKGEQQRSCVKTYDCPSVDTSKPDETRSCTPTPEQIAAVQQAEAQQAAAQQAAAQQAAAQQAAAQQAAAQQAAAQQAANNTPTAVTEAPVATETPDTTMETSTASDGMVVINQEVLQLLSTNQTTFEDELNQELASQKEVLLQEGKTKSEVEQILQDVAIQKRAENRVANIRQVSRNVFGVMIDKNTQDSNGDGISDELAVHLGLDPRAANPTAGTDLTAAESLLFRTNPVLINQRCSMNVAPGTKLSSKGFTILSACPLNRSYTLYARDASGNEAALATEKIGDNHKVVFTIQKPFTTGEYLLQVRSASGESALSSDSTNVMIVDDSELNLTQPVVRKIEDVSVEGARDIQVFQTADGRIHVTGIADVSSTVIVTFASAIFNSALLADTQSGAFEIASSQALETGDHSVTVFTTRAEDSTQSAPVKIGFAVVPGRGAALTKSLPVAATAGIALIVLGMITVVVVRKMHHGEPVAQMAISIPPSQAVSMPTHEMAMPASTMNSSTANTPTGIEGANDASTVTPRSDVAAAMSTPSASEPAAPADTNPTNLPGQETS